jgi:ankyrin repeat protein
MNPLLSVARLNAPLLAGQKRKLNEVMPSLDNSKKPVDLVHAVVTEHDRDARKESSLGKVNFLIPTEEMIEAYTIEIVKAAREADIQELRRLHSSGNSLQCCNRFGESLMHIICRRGELAIVRFLVEEANVSLLVRDDYGRTPLHDAFWASEPRFELVRYIVKKEPQLLCVKDVRGHTPLNYARKEHWGEWREFFIQNKTLLRLKRESEDDVPTPTTCTLTTVEAKKVDNLPKRTVG